MIGVYLCDDEEAVMQQRAFPRAYLETASFEKSEAAVFRTCIHMAGISSARDYRMFFSRAVPDCSQKISTFPSAPLCLPMYAFPVCGQPFHLYLIYIEMLYRDKIKV